MEYFWEMNIFGIKGNVGIYLFLQMLKLGKYGC